MADEPEVEVLFVAGPMEVRGSCTYTLRLAERLREHGISVRIASPDTRRVTGSLRSRLHLTEYRRIQTPGWGRFVRWWLLRDAQANPPALIHIQSRQALKLGNWLARRLRRPYVLTIHDHLGARERLPIDPVWCRRIIAVSDSVREDLVERQGFLSELITVIPGGVEAGRVADCPAPLDPGHIPVVGTAGPLEAVKGLPYFLGAARRVLDVRKDLEFLVAGAGPEEANLRRMARELRIAERVTFVPGMSDFHESLAAMDIFCLPSLQQGLGTIMLEAMALGRPVIATGVGGTSAVVRDGETGLIVPPRDSAALARRILELLENPTLARAIGTAGRRLVDRDFPVERMVLKTAELYHEISQWQPKSSQLAPS
jgi:glycosyltransferase involved in cell wall biosynthesis